MAGADVLGSGDITYPMRVGNLFVETTLNAASGTTAVTLFTAPQGYFITHYFFAVDAICTIAAAGMIDIQWSDSINGLLTGHRIYLPVTGATPNAVPTVLSVTSGTGFYRSGKSAGATVSVKLSVALTAGSIRTGITYGLTNILG